MAGRCCWPPAGTPGCPAGIGAGTSCGGWTGWVRSTGRWISGGSSGIPSPRCRSSAAQRIPVGIPATWTCRRWSSRGVRVGGRLAGIDGTRVEFADDLQANAAAADASLARLLHRIDDHVVATGLQFTVGPAARPRPFTPEPGPAAVDLRAAGIRSVVWATGYRRRYPWLQVPVLDAAGEIRHSAGLTAAPGLVVVGQRWQTRRSSTFLDGVRHDARLVVDHLMASVLAETGRKAS